MLSRVRIVIASCCITYLSAGIAGATLGPLLPELAGRTGIALSGAGLILSFYFLGALLSRLIGGLLSDRFGSVPVVLGGLAVEICSAVTLTVSRSPALLLASAFLLGVALGAGLLGAVMIAAKLVPGRSVALVNLVNAFWGIGSFVGPALFSGVSASMHSGLPVIWIAGLIGVVAILLLLNGDGRQSTPADGQEEDARRSEAPVSSGPPRAAILRDPTFWLFGLVLLFDVGAESTIGGWTAVYLHRSTPVSLQTAALVVSGFFVCFAAGRITTASIGTHVAAPRVLALALLVAVAGTGLVSLTPGHLVPSIAGFLLAGLGIGPIYPTITAFVSRSFGARAGTAVGLTGSLGFVGGVVFPWTAGLLMPALGASFPMRLALLLILVVALLSFLAGRSATRRQARERPSPPTKS